MTGNSEVFGMGYPVAALEATYTPGTGITYTGGFVIGTGVEAVLNHDISDNPDYGDDEEQDNDNGTNRVSGSLELNGIAIDKRAKLLGWTKEGTGTDEVYHITDDTAPYVGFGYYKRDVLSGGYIARWLYRVKFSRSTDTARTKQRNVEWNHPSLDFSGGGVYLATPENKMTFYDEKPFDDREDAKAWLNTKAGISAQSSTQGSNTQGSNTQGSGATGNP